MKYLFVPYTLARLAKENGFNEECFGYFYQDLKQNWRVTYPQTQFSRWYTGKEIIAPLYQQLVDWFRKEHQIAVCQTVNGQWFACKIEGGLGLNEVKHFPAEGTCAAALTEAFKLIKRNQ